MRSIKTDADKELLILDLQDLLNLADVDRDDNDWIRDQKIAAYLNRRRTRTIEHDLITFQDLVDQAMKDGIQVLILKEKNQ